MYLSTVEVGGEDGSVAMGDDAFIFWRFRDESEADEEIRGRYLRFPAAAVGAADPSAGFNVDGHRENLAEFLTALQQGRKPLVDGIEARKAVQIVLAVYESARRGGAPVRLS